MVSSTVVNIRTVKTVKGGGRVSRHYSPGPFGKEDPLHDFFNKLFGDEQQREFKQRSCSPFEFEQTVTAGIFSAKGCVI